MHQSPTLFTCPKCRHTYLGHDPLPDCPRCGYDYREREGFRWDVMLYLLAIIALMSFRLGASHYRGTLPARTAMDGGTLTRNDEMPEKLPGSGTSGARPFQSPYHKRDR